MSNRVLGIVDVSRFIQIIGQISRLPRSTALRAKGCASLEMTTKWSSARKPPNLPNLPTIYNLFMQNKANFRKSQVNANTFTQKVYENKSDWTPGENKPNSKPNKANFQIGRQTTEYSPSGLVPAKRGPLAMTTRNIKYRIMKEN